MNDKKEVFHSFRKNPKPLPMIKVKIGEYNKDIEKILNTLGKSYDFKNFRQERKKPESKINKKVMNDLALLKKDKVNDKINFGPITYLTYKENQENNKMIVSKYSFEFLKKKLLNSKNFKVGSYKDNSLSKHNNFNLTERTNKIDKKINIGKYNQIKNIEVKNKKKIEIKNLKNNLNDNDIEDKKNDYYNILDSLSNSNRIFKSTVNEVRNVSNENKNPKMILKLNEDINDLELDRNNIYSRNSISQTKNNISLNNRTFYSFQNNNTVNNISNKYTSTNYNENRENIKKPLDLKEIKLKSKTSNQFNDYNELIKYYKTNNNFLKSMHNANNQLQSLTMINELFDIEGIEQFHKEKYNYFKKKKKKIKFKDKLIKKNKEKRNSLVNILSEGKKKMKNEVKARINKIKKQIDHLLLVDKIEKYSDSIPSEKMKTFNIEYNKKSEKIGISDNCITLKNGKIYQPPESDSKKLNQKISHNCDELYKLMDQILIDRYYFSEKESKCKRLTERVKEEKIDLSPKLLV